MRHVGQAHQRLGAGVVELVFHLPRGVQRVGVDHDEPGAHGAEHHDGILDEVGQLHRDAVARLEIGVLLQVGGEIAGQLVQLTVGQGLAEIAERRLVREALARLFEHSLDVLVLVGIDLAGDPNRILILPEVIGHEPHS